MGGGENNFSLQHNLYYLFVKTLNGHSKQQSTNQQSTAVSEDPVVVKSGIFCLEKYYISFKNVKIRIQNV